MDFTRVSRAELFAIVGGVLLGIGLFLSWYHVGGQPDIATLAGKHAPATLSGWNVHTTLRYLLVAGAAAPLILTYIVLRGHALSWPRGELTAVVAIFAFGLIAYNAFLNKPGQPRGEISLEYGVFVSIVGTLAMLLGAATRTSEAGLRRKPPGVL